MVKEVGVGDGVKGSSEIEEDEYCAETGVSSQ